MRTLNEKTRKNLAAWLPILLALLGMFYFVFQAYRLAHSLNITMDEGTYLVKGKWFLENTYTPFQDNGPITNKMPLAFLVPGLSQVLFGDGIRSGRYFSIFLAVITLLGIWLTVRKVANPWWAAAAICCVAITPAWIIDYARAISQVVSSLFITWSIFFVLGRKQSVWKLVAGALLGSMAVLTRQNLLPYLGILMCFIIWQYGWKKGGLASLTGLLSFALVHAAYWPGIFDMIWRKYFPANISQAIHYLEPLVGTTSLTGTIAYQPIVQIQVIAGGLANSFIPVFLFILVCLCYPIRLSRSEPTHKAVIFLWISYFSLLLIHIWAVIDNNDLLYSFPSYLNFFNPIALILFPLAYPSLKKQPGKIISGLTCLFILAFSAGMGLHLYRSISDWILNLDVPRITGMRFLPGTTDLWRMVYNKFHIDFHTQEFIFPTLAGFLVGVLVILLTWVLWRLWRRSIIKLSYIWFLAATCFILGVSLNSRIISLAGTPVAQCKQDIIQAYETVGEELKAQVPPGSLVYWDSGLSPILLSSIPGVRTFPTQLNQKFYYIVGGDADQLEKRNRWNETLAKRWLFEADYVLLDNAAAKVWEPQMFGVYKGGFDQLEPTSNAVPCVARTFLRVYQVIH